MLYEIRFSGTLDRRLAVCLLSLSFLWLLTLCRTPSKEQPNGYFESMYAVLESIAVVGSPAQWIVTLLGLCLFPALSRSGRSGPYPAAGAGGSSELSTQATSRKHGPGSHSIEIGRQYGYQRHGRGSAFGLLKRLRRVLSEGRAQARRLCGPDSVLQKSVPSFSRKRSFGSRSSKSEDVLSSRLSSDSLLRGASQPQTATAGGRRGFFQRSFNANGNGGNGNGSSSSPGMSGSRWRPSMSRIASGQHLAGMVPSESSLSSTAAGKRLEILSHNGFQAVDCLAHETTDPAFAAVRQAITDTHLLQFGAMIGEASAELALSQAGSAAAVGPLPGSLLGPYDRRDLYRQGWELVLEEHKPGLHYWSWRRPLRKGLYMYKSKTVYEAATTAQYIDFTYDMEYRRTWDELMICQIAIPPPPASAATAAAAGDGSGASSSQAVMSLAEAEAKSAGGGSAFMFSRTKFPPPMAAREYTYVRRSWAKPDDGGCYCISRDFAHPSPPAAGGRAVRVSDFVSAYVIRSSKGIFDTASPAVEAVNVYFEDAGVASGLANMSVRRALWPMVQKTEAAFRGYQLTRVHGSLEQPPPERAVALDSLGAAMGAGAARAAAAAANADAASCMGGLEPGAGDGARWWQRLRLGSPDLLLYRAYMALWRGGRSAVLAAASCCMSLWCGATGLLVSAGCAVRSGVRATMTAARAVPATSSQLLLEAVRYIRSSSNLVTKVLSTNSPSEPFTRAGRLAALVLWPWEALAAHHVWGWRRAAAVAARPTAMSTAGNAAHSGRLTHGSGGGARSSDRLSSHPLFRSGIEDTDAHTAAPGRIRRLSVTPPSGSARSSGAGSLNCGPNAPQSPRGGSRSASFRARQGSFVRRWTVLAVKVAKVAGAGLLLGRAARAEAGVGAAEGHAGPARQQQQQQQVVDGQQQQQQHLTQRKAQGQQLGGGYTMMPEQWW
ncbi:hypothetical protein Agub_g1349 [Astrephomene gubernaculifera]|uniref:START domain-containing protein n=1 Tax=Astrephomene gubernaculifera TaxID=47775 RepID=A0AAD3DF90_9CHLO|nr:hypothetical protein Agub_g1349 [Astrephomene gubernaculifera]